MMAARWLEDMRCSQNKIVAGWAGAWLLALPVLVACTAGGSGDKDVDANTSTSAMVDTMLFSPEAARIAGLAIDTARLVPWQAAVTVPGRLMLDPTYMETIGSITEGRITHVTVRVGDRVRAGDALVMIHSHETMDARKDLLSARAALDAALAERDLAQTAADRAKRLFEGRAMSRAELERAEVALRVATSNYAAAQAEYDHSEALIEHLIGVGPVPDDADEHDVLIRTPIDGVVTERVAQPGSVVLPGSPLLTVGNPDRLQLQMHLAENMTSGVTIGSTVRYALTNSPNELHDAVVARIAPTVDTLTRTIEVLARPIGPVVGRAESFVQANILGKGSNNAVVVPITALQAIEADTIVFIATPRDSSMLLRAVPVRIGRHSVDRVEVLAGLEPGTLILSRGTAIARAELLRHRGLSGGE